MVCQAYTSVARYHLSVLFCLDTVVTSHIRILEHARIDYRVVETKPWGLSELCNTALAIVNLIPALSGERESYIDALLAEHITLERRTMTGLDLGIRPVGNVVFLAGLPDGNEDIVPTVQQLCGELMADAS